MAWARMNGNQGWGATMKKITMCLCCGTAMFVFFGCASFTPVTISADDATMPICISSNINHEYEIVKHVRLEQRVPLLFLQRMFAQCNPDIQGMIEQEIADQRGDAFVNMRIAGTAKAGDVLLPLAIGIGGAFIAPGFLAVAIVPFFVDLRTYTVEGDVVRCGPEPPPLPLKKARMKFDPETGAARVAVALQ